MQSTKKTTVYTCDVCGKSSECVSDVATYTFRDKGSFNGHRDTPAKKTYDLCARCQERIVGDFELLILEAVVEHNEVKRAAACASCIGCDGCGHD